MEARFGRYGGQYVPETVMPALKETEAAYEEARNDRAFQNELKYYLKNYAGRPTLLYEAKNLTEYYGKGKILLKREDLLHTGAHKINNAIGQALLAKRMGKTKIVAETGAGQHGVASATVAALFDMECIVFMGTEDIERQKPNVFRMEMLGAKVEPVSSGTGTLKDATSEAIRYWASHCDDTYYLIGSCVGPHPYPTMVRDFQSCISREARAQCIKDFSRLPTHVIACVGGGSNSIGAFYEFIDDKRVKLIGVEAGGKGAFENARTLSGKGRPGVLHGSYSYLLQTQEGQVIEAYSISAGLDYPGVGPEHSFFKDDGRIFYDSVTDQQALNAFKLLTKLEGIIPALESAHAVAYLEKLMPQVGLNDFIVICLSGRGDKDVERVAEIMRNS